MNTIDSLLGASPGPLPKRPLSRSFTQATLARLGGKPAPRRRGLGWLVRHRPIAAAMLSLGAVFLIGGGAYGLANGFGFLNVLFGGERRLDDGGRLLKITTSDCAFEWYDSLSNSYAHTNQTLYYRVESGSKLTSEQIAQMAQGACEVAQDTRSDAMQREVLRRHSSRNGGLCFGTSNVRVTGLTPQMLTTVESREYSGGDETLYTEKIDNKAIVIDEQGQLRPWSDVQLGDYGSTVYYCDKSSNVLGFIKNSANMVAYYEGYSSHYGKDFVRVIPCDTDPSGYCKSER